MQTAHPLPQSGTVSSLRTTRRRFPRWAWIVLALLIIAAGMAWYFQSRATPAATTTTVPLTRGDLTLTVNGNGSVAPAASVDLPFQVAGQVTAVKVAVGDAVKAGQPLATLDTRDLQNQVAAAQAAVQSAQANLDQLQHGGSTPQDLANAQAAVQAAQAAAHKTRTGNVTAADIQSAQAAVQSAQAKLDALKNPSPAALSAAQSTLTQAQTNLQTTTDGDSAAKNNAYQAMQQATDNLTKAQSAYSTAQQNWQYVQDTGNDPTNPSTINAAGKKVANKLNDVQRQQYYDAFVQAQAALQSAQSAVQQAQITYDTARQKEAADVPQAQQQIAAAQAQLDALQHPTADDITQAQATLTQAQAALTKLKQGGTPDDIAAAQAQVVQAQSSLDKLTAPSAPANIASGQASLANAQAALQTAQLNLDRATLPAPFDGVVAAVDVTPGTIVSASTVAVTVIDRSKLHLALSLSESDAAAVQVGQLVQVSFDALPNVTLKGAVTNVAPNSTTVQNVVTYQVLVSIDPGKSPVKAGMSATAIIQTQTISGALLVPSRAIQTRGANQIIQVDLAQSGSAAQPTSIQIATGASANGQTVITKVLAPAGLTLNPGDQVVVPSVARTSTTTGGGFGGGAGGRGSAGSGVPFLGGGRGN
jgi:HlyD family secretion protein